jgi:hypothetical protein
MLAIIAIAIVFLWHACTLTHVCVIIAQKVHFLAEEAVDTGGPSREFWRLFAEALVEQYCVGDEGAYLFVKNIPALQVCVVSLEQGFRNKGGGGGKKNLGPCTLIFKSTWL